MADFGDAKFVGAYTAGYLGVTGSLIGIYAWLDPMVIEGWPWGLWASVCALLAYFLGLSIGIHLRAGIREESHPVGERNLYDSLTDLARGALDQADYREVVRLGDALSRPLFESGQFEVRLALGRLTEEAAAHIGATQIQYRTLIDAIGWSLIELGRFDEAEKAILHGLSLAEEAGDGFYLAKGHRHLGAIERRRGRMVESLAHYEHAHEIAQSISDSREAAAMDAGIVYAMAHLEYSRGSYPGALEKAELAIKKFGELRDIYRVDMALVLKADIQVALQKVDRARDTYRQVIQSSRMNKESVHYSRAMVGLIELHIKEGQPIEAKRLLDRLDAEEPPTFVALEGRLNAARAALRTSLQSRRP